MERRAEKRHRIGFKGELLYGGKSYFGSVENISENGLNMTAYPLNRAIDFNAGTELEMKFQFLSGEVVNVRCELKWSYKTLPHELMFSIGSKIIESSREYREFLKALGSKIRKPRVIIFDDEESFLSIFKKWLSQMDYQVFTFHDPAPCKMHQGSTGHCMKENPCADIIFTDYNMPEINGIELLQYQSQMACKVDNRNKAVVSGFVDDALKKIVNESGYAFFEKPLDLTVVSSWLNECGKRIDLSLPLSDL